MRYAGAITLSIIVLFVAIFATLVSVFAIEKLTNIIDIFLRFKIEPRILLLLYASILPDVADFILPIAVLIAVYVVVLRKREAREFLVLSSAGVGHRHLLVAGFGSAVVAVVLCGVLSGFVKPYASLAYRQQYAQAFANALSKGISGGQIYRQEENFMFVSAPSAGAAKQMRVFSFKEERLERLTISDCAELRAFGERILADLCDARIYLFGVDPPGVDNRRRDASSPPSDVSGCRFCTTETGDLDVARIQIGRSSLAFDMNTLLGQVAEPQSRNRSVVDLLGMRNGVFRSASDARLAGTYILLSLTCLLAVSIAFGAVAATAQRTGPLALGGGIALLIAAIVAASSGILLIGPVRNPLYFAGLVGTTALICAGTIVFVVYAFHRKLVTPMFMQA
ncbi:MAG: LptF/LptG family permease [Mesorhizobium sp.]|nr:LptF/LptG family permease [Mesorhizobium sp.]